jgi:hypothetical protein
MKFQKTLKKQKGQISVFLALVFFVMFSIFGMTISMGMFIHDKINLQNSTDLASYYVAAKQAEMLGAIAHSNYQIRQSWKLLAFRYRVLGNASRTNNGMMSPGIMPTPDNFLTDHSEYQPAAHSGGVPPRVCMGAAHVFRESPNDNYCKIINFSVNYIPNVPQIIGIGIVGATNDTIDSTNTIISSGCSGTAYLNWWYANTIIGAHKLEQRDRRAVIDVLAANLALPIQADGMKDLDGQDVYEGARKTFLFNLSESNRLEGAPGIRFKNSLEGKNPSDWLSPIYVNAIVPWSFFNGEGSGCSEQVFNHPNDSSLGPLLVGSSLDTAKARLFRDTLDPNGRTKDFGNLSGSGDQLMGFSVGVEKNPWVMVYNQAEAVVTSKPLFLSSIFGAGIPMRAFAYAKPFGGRVGPWYEKTWPSGGSQSSGGGKTDPLLPQRVDFGSLGAVADATSDPTYFPNYSRHPGDQDGMTTKASQVSAGRLIDWTIDNPTTAVVRSSMRDYIQTTYSYFNALSNDPLAQNSAGPAPWESFNRNLEIAAVRPDAFDMIHYSISPTFYNYYVKDKLDQWLPSILPADVELRGDLGFHRNGPPGINDFDIKNQMDLTEFEGVDRSAKAAWVANTNKQGFLSGWIPGLEVMDYGPPDSNRFATCVGTVPNGRVMIPSECITGGRVGYSVKLISRKYLEASHPIGGGGSAGSIVNPPDSL